MLLKILVVGAVLIGAMAVIRDGTVLRDAGLLHSCHAVTADGMTVSCSKGRLDGFPDMTTKSCQLVAVRQKRQIWRCDAPVVSSQTPNG